jgi:transcription elongation GreA/GreB family factor
MSRAFVRECDADPGPLLPSGRVRFGMRVMLRLPSHVTQAFRLVGEDEADASCGLISWMAPLAQALLGRESGERVPFQGGEAEILSIEP